MREDREVFELLDNQLVKESERQNGISLVNSICLTEQQLYRAKETQVDGLQSLLTEAGRCTNNACPQSQCAKSYDGCVQSPIGTTGGTD